MQQQPTSAHNVQLLHLGAVTIAHRMSMFAIRARIAFVFRNETGALVYVRLHPVQPPASLEAGPSAINLIFTGRWRTACAFLQQNNLVQIDCPSVQRSEDKEVNSIALQLDDPVSDPVRAPITSLYLLDDASVPIRVVHYRKIHLGMTVPSADTIAHFAKPVPWAPPEQPAVLRQPIRPPAAAREYTYTPIAHLAGDQAPPKDAKVNVYGVVVDCRAPCITRGPDLRCEVLIADETSVQKDASPLRTMAIHRFERNPADSVPFRSVGDIIRVHRVHVDRFRDPVSGVDQLQGVARYYSTFLMWAHDTDEFAPLSARDPVRASKRDANPPNNVTHTVTAHDRERITALRKWGRDYLFKVHKIQRPYLRNLLEVANALPNADFLSLSFDLVCCMEGEYDDESGIGNLRFVVSDGLLSRDNGGKRMLVESDISPDHKEKAPQYPFVDFCPSWPMRPRSLPAWVLIRDVRVVSRDDCRVLVLSVSRKTSTVIWHPHNSPDVRHMKELFARTAGVDRQVQVLKASLDGTLPPAGSPQSVPTGHPVQAQKNGAHKESSGAAQLDGRSSTAGATRNTPKRPYSPPKLASHVAEGQPLHKLQVVATSGAEKSAKPSDGTTKKRFDESKAKSIEQGFQTERHIITVHSNQDKKTTTIAEMLKAVKNGQLGPCRLCVNARSCISPQDVRFACQPSKIVKDLSDPDVSWTYAVLLNLEDESGGRIEGWIEGKEGAEFFNGIAPTNLTRDKESRQVVSTCLQTVLSPHSRLDCSVKPYEYEDEHGLYRAACKIFATRLLPEYISGEKRL